MLEKTDKMVFKRGLVNGNASRRRRTKNGIMAVGRHTAPLAALLLLAGCGGGISLDETSTAVRIGDALPAPDSTQLAVDPLNYRLGPTDVIVVSVFGASELDRESSIDAAGNFSMPLAGTLSAAGKTPQQLAEAIEAQLRGKYLRDPHVTVNVKQALAHRVTVDGEVAEPGVYPLFGPMTLQQAIASAKGPSDVADIKKVIIFRTVEGQRMAAMFNLLDIRRGRHPDPQIYGNDIIVVGESATRRFLKDYGPTIPLLGTFVRYR